MHLPKANGKITKLAPNLFNKTEYEVHYHNLKYYIRRGMVLTKIHHVVAFRQSKFMAAYIQECAERRCMATNEFKRFYHKLCANSLYGKKAESVRKRIDLRIIQTRAGFDRCASQPNLHRVLVFNDHSVGLQMTKMNIKLTKPIAVGFAILEHAKRHIYECHELMTTKIFERDKMTLCHTDTDSLLYEIHVDDLFAKLADIRSQWLDTSNYPPPPPRSSFAWYVAYRGIVNLFRDKNSPDDAMPVEFIGLKSKMYSILTKSGLAQMRSKGIVQWLNDKFRPNRALHDKSMKLGTIILDTIRVILKTGGILYLYRGGRGTHFPWWPPVNKIGQYVNHKSHVQSLIVDTALVNIT